VHILRISFHRREPNTTLETGGFRGAVPILLLLFMGSEFIARVRRDAHPVRIATMAVLDRNSEAA
jgi:hypothetical protein